MIEFEEALKTVKHATIKMGTEHVELIKAPNRVLAEDVRSDMAMPPFDKSTMDGYACRRSDLGNLLEIKELIPAGTPPTKNIGPNQCSKIMTGAKIPEGADCVIMIEHTKEVEANKIRFIRENTATNICYRGEDMKENEVVLKKGTRIKAQHIAVMATVGCAQPLVYQQPKVGIIATGSELVEPDQKPGASQIRNSNAWQLIAQLQKMGLTANYYGIAIDSPEITRELMEKCLSESEVLLLSGGVSIGDLDFVPQILKDMGFNTWFRKLSVKPGTQTIFSTYEGKYVLGMPGNPVSSFVQFELLAKPMLFRLMGHDYHPPIVRLPLARNYKRKKTERLEFIPVRFNAHNQVVPLSYHGSAHINAFTEATGIMAIPIGVKKYNEGDLVHVRQI